MIPAVFDCSVVAAGIGWTGNPRFCLDLVYGGQVLLCLTTDIWEEYTRTVLLVLAARKRNADATAEPARLLKVAHFVEPAALGKQRSRDPADDHYIAAALGAGAEAVVTSDRDLLALGKTFGVAMLTPIEFIKRVCASGLI